MGARSKSWGWIALASVALALARGSLGATRLLTSLGTTLSPEKPRAAWLVSPEIDLALSPRTTLRLAASVTRPFDPHENFRLPKTQATILHRAGSGDTAVELSTGLAALDLHRWGVDGAMARALAAAEGSLTFLPGWSASLQLAIFLQLNAYAQSAAGRDLARHGFGQKLVLSWEHRALTVEVALTASQRRHGSWKNELGTYEEIRLAVSPGVAIGVSHELVADTIDPTTGLERGVRLFDARESRLSVLARLAL